jgi:uncharacterized protein
MRSSGDRTSAESYRVRVEEDVEMVARDGTVLRADVYRPDAEGVYPTLLLRSPYGKRRRGHMAQNTEVHYFPQRGYNVVIQDTRGRGRSDGVYYPFLQDGPDTYDAVEWAATQPWSDGNVGMVGQSYLASVQYAVTGLNPPHLRALSPVAGGASHFERTIYRRGVLELQWRLAYFTAMERLSYKRAGSYETERSRLDSYVRDPQAGFSLLTDEAYRHLPLKDWGGRLRGQAPYLEDFLEHSTYSSFWAESNPYRMIDAIRTPTLHVGSWYDAFQEDTLRMFSESRQRSATEEARLGQRLLMGPWAHLQPYSVPTTGGTGDIDFGEEAAIELHALQLRWFDYWLKGISNGVSEDAPVRIFVMGVNRWRDEQEWPLARTVIQRLYLHSDGHANTRNGNGRLRWDAPSDGSFDQYLFDPSDPVPTNGGQFLGDGSGVRDQRSIQERPDVLVYVGEALPEQVEVTGQVQVELWAASSVADTDFTGKLVDIHPDGFAQNIVDGIVRARFRASIAEPSPIQPGRVYRYTIDLWSTSHVFLEGHRICLEVSSSNFPRYDRNAGSGLPLGEDRQLFSANQTVFHDGARPSAVLLPVIPASRP